MHFISSTHKYSVLCTLFSLVYQTLLESHVPTSQIPVLFPQLPTLETAENKGSFFCSCHLTHTHKKQTPSAQLCRVISLPRADWPAETRIQSLAKGRSELQVIRFIPLWKKKKKSLDFKQLTMKISTFFYHFQMR